MTEIKGVPVSDGQAIGKIFLLAVESLDCESASICADALLAEKKKMQDALDGAREETKSLIALALEEGQEEQNEVFECYLEMLHDDELITDIGQYIETELVSLETALSYVCTDYVRQMLEIDDPYFQARADDFKQIFRMIKTASMGGCENSNKPTEAFILAAKEIGPADMAKVDKKLLQGFILETGSRTSHAAIISRAMGIPMISSIKDIEKELCSLQNCAMDGSTGIVYLSPDSNLTQKFQQSIEIKRKEKEEIKKLLHEEAVTLDGKHITLFANIGTIGEVAGILENNADGIGLFRTEFLFMENGGNRLPTEEEQFNSYKTVLSALNGKPVIFRTLDAGGDKNIAALGIPKEENPFLGWRAIRYCLKRPEVFRIQIRALLRASIYGNAKIMIPMIISKDEVLQTKKIINEIYAELKEQGEPVKKDIPVGIMIETPAAAVNAEELAKVSDFFSIGTNDLTQYTLAVDRGNEEIADLYDEGHPAVINLIKHVIAVGNKAGIPVDICGEMAGNSRFTEILLKSGLREFSMSPILILEIKKLIRSLKTV